MDKIKQLLTVHKTTVILLVSLLLLIVGGYFAFQKFISRSSSLVEEADLAFDAEGPYALLFSRRDGNALILNLKRTASHDSITYELAYTSQASEVAMEGGKIKKVGDGEDVPAAGAIDRGVTGTIDTKDRKGEYEQEILFGTCSKNVCKYDKGVENGTLTLHIRKGKKAFRMVTQWHLQRPDVALGNLTSGDSHMIYQLESERQALSNIGFSITADLTGVPKLPAGKEVLGKVYALNVPIAKDLPVGVVSLELAQNPPAEAKLYRYNGSKSEWEQLDTQIEGAKLSAKANGAGIFAVLTPKK